MTVRGKNKVLVCLGAACVIVGVVFLYHNAARRLDETRLSLERCSRNEESLTSQLQVILDYKVRLEKSLQQEKSEHAQTKEDMRNKADEERQIREKDNMESINKFTALQQQYKLLQSQHEDVTQELEKLKQQHLTDLDDKSRLEARITSLSHDVKLLKESRDTDITLLKSKNEELEKKIAKWKLTGDWEKEKSDLQRELTECLKSNNLPINSKSPAASILMKELKKASSSTPSSNLLLGEPSAGFDNMHVSLNTSTPMVNPQAIASQDQLSKINVNVLPQPAIAENQIMDHIPIAAPFNDQLSNQQQMPLLNPQKQQQQQPMKLDVEAYQADYDKDRHKEEDDDDVDPPVVDYRENANNVKAAAQFDQKPILIPPFRDSIVIQPK